VIVHVVNVSVSVDAHAFDADNVIDPTNTVPDVCHSEMFVIVSLVPPFVHGPVFADNASDRADDVVNDSDFFELSPTLTFEVPAAPGLPVCSCAVSADTAVYAVPFSVFSHPSRIDSLSPSAIYSVLPSA
jgi:hypothetical protein